MSQLCECGCGEPTPISKETDRGRGWIKGEPRRFVPGHHHRFRSQNKPTCTIEGCNAEHRAHGWCDKHYARWLRTGSPVVVRGNPTAARPIRERLAARIDKNAPGGCWQWTGRLNNAGYGSIAYLAKRWYVHRLMYELERGAIPEGLQIDHLCRNRGCCNPDHLEPVTVRENVWRGEAPCAVFNRTGQCQRGHDLSVFGVYVTPAGKQQCRRCAAIRQDRRRKQQRAERAMAAACPKCSAPQPPGAGFCKSCGAPIGQ